MHLAGLHGFGATVTGGMATPSREDLDKLSAYNAAALGLGAATIAVLAAG